MSKRSLTGDAAVLKIESELATHGVLRTTDANGRPRYEVTCGYDGKTAGVFNSKVQNADHLLAHFRKMGWRFTYKDHPYCSTQCMRLARRKQKEDQQTAQRQAEERRNETVSKHPIEHPPYVAPAPSIAAAAIAAPVAPPTPISPNMQIVVKVVTMLNEHFDKGKRLYNAHWSDERIAKEADTSLTFVVAYREGAYGKLAEDPERTKFREDLKALEDLHIQYAADITHRMDEMRARLDRLTGVHHKAQG